MECLTIDDLYGFTDICENEMLTSVAGECISYTGITSPYDPAIDRIMTEYSDQNKSGPLGSSGGSK